MFLTRLLVTIILVPFGLAFILWGGWPYIALILLILLLAAWEYIQLIRQGGCHPAGPLILGGVLLLAIGRAVDGFASASWMLSLIVLASMAYALWQYERGDDRAVTSFGISLAGILYLGWIGSYFLSIRALPEGQWWVLVVLPSVWFADAGAYIFGKRFGRHPLVPRLSPKKTWEGYLAGVVVGTLAGFLLPYLWAIWAGPSTAVTPLRGLIIGFAMSVLTTLGDLGESMIKRQAGAKDSGHLIPGHGGVFDRIDSWLWAAVIGYYLIIALVPSI